MYVWVSVLVCVCMCMSVRLQRGQKKTLGVLFYHLLCIYLKQIVGNKVHVLLARLDAVISSDLPISIIFLRCSYRYLLAMHLLHECCCDCSSSALKY